VADFFYAAPHLFEKRDFFPFPEPSLALNRKITLCPLTKFPSALVFYSCKVERPLSLLGSLSFFAGGRGKEVAR